jgi:hypothetical protein
MERNNKDTFCLSQVKREGYGITDLLDKIKGVVKHRLANQIVYTKTVLVFGFSKNQILVAVIPGLESAEDFTRAKLFLDFLRKLF